MQCLDCPLKRASPERYSKNIYACRLKKFISSRLHAWMLLLFQRQPPAVTLQLPIQHYLPGLVSQLLCPSSDHQLPFHTGSTFPLLSHFILLLLLSQSLSTSLYQPSASHSCYWNWIYFLPFPHSLGLFFSTNTHFPQFSKHLSHNQISEFCLYVLVFLPHSVQLLPFLPSPAP